MINTALKIRGKIVQQIINFLNNDFFNTKRFNSHINININYEKL